MRDNPNEKWKEREQYREKSISDTFTWTERKGNRFRFAFNFFRQILMLRHRSHDVCRTAVRRRTPAGAKTEIRTNENRREENQKDITPLQFDGHDLFSSSSKSTADDDRAEELPSVNSGWTIEPKMVNRQRAIWYLICASVSLKPNSDQNTHTQTHRRLRRNVPKRRYNEIRLLSDSTLTLSMHSAT